MTVSEKSHQNLSDYIQFLFEKKLNLLKKGIISSENMLTCSSERIFSPRCYTGLLCVRFERQVAGRVFSYGKTFI